MDSMHPPSLSFAAIVPALFSLRGFLLAFASIVFLSLCGIFFRVSRTLRYSSSFVKDLEPFLELGSYSQDLAVMVANEDAESKGNEAVEAGESGI